MADSETPRKTFPTMPRGGYTRIARRHRLSVNHVREVYLGNRKSPRVEKAIESFFERLQAKQEQSAA